ncbi:glycosyltransferase family 2 protein [Treponema brennaborense]|uniref:Glycosyl transferase family 2 n=1 Tax=Treponema brennaborense (strain DSM 12168 / CIP 105900 / DD5/3) TaxID=906968 RepID=F4LK10_TREBD|nr:glycosyltransferase [Treponema brennaborense]AEE17472.1 glycosyl transferase family 2 [Treponema brennaborense DSM 12168]
MLTFELLVSTMHKNQEQVLQMLQDENIHCDSVVINQCDENKNEELRFENQSVRIFYTTERGLSRSRNMAIRNARADIVAIADDDLFYYDSFDRTILNYYEKNSMADVVMFNMDSFMKKFGNHETKCKFTELGTYISVQTCLNRSALLKKNVWFRETFGTGSKVFDAGEENIFLADCFRSGLKIYYCPDKILKHEQSDSTWFKGFNDPKFLSDRGAIYCAISPVFSWLYYLRFVIVKRKIIKPISMAQAFKLILNGRKKYKRFLKEEKKI